MSKTVHLQMPLTEQQVRDLELGDEVFLSGDAFCMLYGSHYTLILDALKAGKKPPMELEGRAIYNTGVIWRREETENRLYALGTTASYKFNAFGPEFIRRTGIRVIIGKGGMDDATLTAMQECGCVFLAIAGGCTSVFTPKARIVEEYLPAIPPSDNQRLRFELNEFGPLMVTMDAHGNSLYHETTDKVDSRRQAVYERAGV